MTLSKIEKEDLGVAWAGMQQCCRDEHGRIASETLPMQRTTALDFNSKRNIYRNACSVRQARAYYVEGVQIIHLRQDSRCTAFPFRPLVLYPSHKRSAQRFGAKSSIAPKIGTWAVISKRSRAGLKRRFERESRRASKPFAYHMLLNHSALIKKYLPIHYSFSFLLP
jgi:hypothetical protein